MSVFVCAGVAKDADGAQKGDAAAQTSALAHLDAGMVSQAEAAVLTEGADCKPRPKA